MALSRRTTMLVLVALVLAAAPNVGAQDAQSQLIEQEDVTADKLLGIFRAAFLKCEKDEDEDITVKDGGMKTIVSVDKDKKLIRFVSLWPMKAHVSEDDKLRLVNRWNDKLILVRFCVSSPTTLWADHVILYENGVYPYRVVATYRLFVTVVKGAVYTQDPDDIIGR